MSENPTKRRSWINTSGLGRIVISAVIIVPLLGLCYLGYAIYRGIAVSLEAEETLHATIITINVVQHYVTEFRRWPLSWEALEEVSVPDGGMYSWPRDLEAIRKRVYIDFDAQTKELARLKAEDCDAIKPIGPHYNAHRGGMASLLKTIREIEEADRPLKREGDEKGEKRE